MFHLPVSLAACRLFASMTTIALCGSALAGPIWDGDSLEDAKQSPQDAQAIATEGTVLMIKGSLGSSGFMSTDTVDMYRLTITDPAILKFSTAGGNFGGDAEFDSQIFLFQAVQDISGQWIAKALLSNNDISDTNTGSFIGNAANDGSGFVLQQAGIYFVAIAQRGITALNPNGEIVWQGINQPGLIPFGNFETFGSWGGDGIGVGGQYEMRVSGVAGTIPAPGAAALLGLVGLFGRRQGLFGRRRGLCGRRRG